jgi:hypothetical protein
MCSSTFQINWKQRFFVQTEEEQGIAILAALLDQFPVIVNEDEEAACRLPVDVAMPSTTSTELVDLENWVIGRAETSTINDTTQTDQTAITLMEEAPTDEMAEATCTRGDESPSFLPITQQSAAVLQTLRPDYRTPAIQIGFNFAKSENS